MKEEILKGEKKRGRMKNKKERRSRSRKWGVMGRQKTIVQRS